MSTSRRYPPEIRERAVHLVFEQEQDYPSQWSAIRSIAEKSGMIAETLRKWVRQAERDSGRRPGLSTEERDWLRGLEKENKELRRANEILKAAISVRPDVALAQAVKTLSTSSPTHCCMVTASPAAGGSRRWRSNRSHSWFWTLWAWRAPSIRSLTLLVGLKETSACSNKVPSGRSRVPARSWLCWRLGLTSCWSRSSEVARRPKAEFLD